MNASGSAFVIIPVTQDSRNFKDIILQAYKWLSQMYQPGDKIFILGKIRDAFGGNYVSNSTTGFSRGAYQARALAGMIEKVCGSRVYFVGQLNMA